MTCPTGHDGKESASPGTSSTSSAMTARTADYLCPQRRQEGPAGSAEMPPPPPLLWLEPIGCTDPLCEIRGRLKKLKHSKGFLASVFDERDKQLYPRDLLVAWAPSRKGCKAMEACAHMCSGVDAGQTSGCDEAAPAQSSGRRAVGILRRSLRFDKALKRASLYIDFVWVMPELRGRQVGRQLLLSGVVMGKQKDVRLTVAGSDKNVVACNLYSSLGFRWTDASQTEMLLEAQHVSRAAGLKQQAERTNALPDESARQEAGVDSDSSEAVSPMENGRVVVGPPDELYAAPDCTQQPRASVPTESILANLLESHLNIMR